MHFSATALFAIFATNVLAAPSTDANANVLMSDITVAPWPQEALDNLAVKAVSPGPAANVVAVSKRENSERDNEKRDITHLYICQDINFGGRCQNLDSERQTCYNLYNGWNDVVSSLGPDSGTTCCIFDDYGCNGGSLCGIVYPGIYNLGDYGWNDRFSAYRCW